MNFQTRISFSEKLNGLPNYHLKGQKIETFLMVILPSNIYTSFSTMKKYLPRLQFKIWNKTP